jgi:hypothetical protein
MVIPLDQVSNLEAVDRNAGGTAALDAGTIIAGIALIGGIEVAASGGYMQPRAQPSTCGLGGCTVTGLATGHCQRPDFPTAQASFELQE